MKQNRQEKPAVASKDGIRETIESVVIAFVLAFLFRTFEAEAFVIPTGSMAPTLMGRHKEVTCESCGYSYRISSSEEVDPDTNKGTGRKVKHATCPNCRRTMSLEKGAGEPLRESDLPSYKGDRILVGKFPYDFHAPERFDVIVFKYPEEAQTNFIKRLIGLPNETLIVRHGNIFTRDEGPAKEAIARKPPDRVRAMLQTVYDNDFLLDSWIKAGWSPRWRPADEVEATQGGWQSFSGGRTFETTGASESPVWLRYQHIVPTHQDWRDFEEGVPFGIRANRPQLITDFTAYNTGSDSSFAPAPDVEVLGLHWVGDLVLECVLESTEGRGEAILELVEGGRRFQCQLDLAKGTAKLSIEGLDDFHPTAVSALQGAGPHALAFANVDDQLLLWVDGELVEFDGATSYDIAESRPTKADLAPVGIAARGGPVRVERLHVLRDVYYVAPEPPEIWTQEQVSHGGMPASPPMNDYPDDPTQFTDLYPLQFRNLDEQMQSLRNAIGGIQRDGPRPTAEEIRQQALQASMDPVVAQQLFPDNGADRLAARLAFLMSTPECWTILDQRRSRDFELGPDEFLVLGDNSVRSKDSRLWAISNPSRDGDRPVYCVTRDLLVGKALFIYWPHSFDRLPGTGIWCPMFPNVERMGFVR